MHLCPGIIALAICITLIVAEHHQLHADARLARRLVPRNGRERRRRAANATSSRRGSSSLSSWSVSLVIFVPSIKFVYRRLIKEYMPPEKVKT